MTLEGKRRMEFATPPLPETETPEFALTPLQLGMVYESVLAGRPWINLEQVVVHLEDEAIEAPALRAAWEGVAARHDALRLRILWRRRVRPMQRVVPRVPVEVAVEDWRELPAHRQQTRLAQFLESDREQGVDLEKGPSWRVTLLHLGPRRSVMVWTVHHALVDGRSIAIVLEDLFAGLSSANRPLAAAAEPSFAAYCAGLAAKDTAEAEQHFRKLLEGFDEPNPLTEEAEGPDNDGSARKRQIDLTLEADLSGALTERAEAVGATLANLVHAAWGIVVARWSGRAEAVFGVTRSGRFVVPGSRRLVGCLINTLPLRLPADEAATADTLLARLRAEALAMQPHEHAALTDIRRWAELPGSQALFSSMVMFERASLTEMLRKADPAWQKRRVDLREEGALPLTLAVYGDRQMHVVLEHDPQMVPADRAGAMLTHFAELLASFAKARPDAPLATLTMLPRAEEAALLALGRPDHKLPEAPPCMASLLEEVAARQPEAAALSMVGHDEVLCHGDLHRRANGLARALVAQGAGPGQIVAVCLGRSPDFVVALLAVLKAGAAFLPVDPTYPRSVIDHMLKDCGARLMVAAPGTEHPEGMTLIPPGAAPADTPPDRPAPDPDRLAYVIYTSGSTGVPKGVRVPMRALVAHGMAMRGEFALTPRDRGLQFASLSFDVSIEEMIPTLLAGAHVILRSEAMAGSVASFLAEVEAQGISVLNLPTAFWHVLVDDMARSSRRLPASVRLVIVGGERINPRALATWQRIVPDVRWLNGYGPTETTITCTLHEPGRIAPGEDIPIGRPTPHARAYVLAADGSLAPRGAQGDLWIGGPAVSDGYIGRDDQTAEAFRPDRFTGRGRIYRTGDRALWRADGALCFLGRRDRQVKVRGFRIDLRHIERVLEKDPAVGRAVALVHAPGTHAARLVAWVTGAEGAPLPDVALLRRNAARQLPPHMLPTLVAVEDFPRTPGGKIDTAALPVPEPQAQDAGSPASADPETLRIAGLMAQTLGLEAVGPDDSFHDLGGHSLMAVQLVGQIEAALGLRLGVGDLHRNPTPRALAEAIRAAQVGPRYIIPIQPQGSLPPLFGVHVLGRNEEYYRPLARVLGPDQPVLGLTVGLLTQDTPIGVEATARCYFDDIQRHYPDGPVSLAAVSLGSYIAFDLARQLHAAGREVRMLALFDAEGPGGRSRLKGTARLMAHGRRLRSEGAGYFLHILSNRLTDLRNRVEKARVRMASAKGETAPLTISTFVAANELAVQAYDAQPIDIPLTIFRAGANVFDSPESTEDGLGWAPVAGAGFELIDVPGDHLSILQPPNVDRLAAQMQRAMRRGKG
jgi:amino acid adenylation domain-containing protein